MENEKPRSMPPERAERMIWVGERHPESGFAPVLRGSYPIGPDGTWSLDNCVGFTDEEGAEEYAAGFRACLAGILKAENAQPSWRMGWEAAEAELFVEAQRSSGPAEGDGGSGETKRLFAAGATAREHGEAFDPARPEWWRDGWLMADYYLLYDAGYVEREEGAPFKEGRPEPWREGWRDAEFAIANPFAMAVHPPYDRR